MFRNLWEHIRTRMPKKGRGKAEALDPLKLPVAAADRAGSALRPLREDLRALGGRRDQGPALLHHRLQEHRHLEARLRLHLRLSPRERGRLDHAGERPPRAVPQLRRAPAIRFPRPNTLLIDSEQLESGDALDDNFRGMAADEIDRFRREIVERTGDRQQAENITDQELLREVMNTVGKHGQLGGSIRCVVSVSMLTEGWDANTVTHVLGVRAFGTQLLCEQVIGRALRRQSYELNEDDRSLQRRICRRLRHSLRLHGQAGHRPAAAAARDDPGQGRPARPRRSRNPLPARRRLSRRAARGAADCRIQRRLRPGTDPRPRRPVDHAELRHHRRRRRPQSRAPGRHAAFHAALPR